MSIDDKFLREPLVMKLAAVYGWNKYESRGRLLDVFALCYDRESDVLPAEDIDLAADLPGLSRQLVATEWAEETRKGLRIRGAWKYIKYLSTRGPSGSAGGRKSGETRRKKAEAKSKVTFDFHEGRSKPSVPDPVPDVVPDPASAPDLAPAGARVIPPGTGRAEPVSLGNVIALPTNSMPTEAQLRLEKLGIATWEAFRLRRDLVATAIGIAASAYQPMRAYHPAHCPSTGRFGDLRDRLLEAGPGAEQLASFVLDRLAEEATETRDIRWLGTNSYTSSGWDRATNMTAGSSTTRRPPLSAASQSPVRKIPVLGEGR